MRNIYTVGLLGSGASFTSIQDAIDQALLDGHDGTDPANIIVEPGTYVEDVAMEAGIFVFGTSDAVLDGTVTVDLTAQVDPEDTLCLWRQVTIAPTGAGIPGVRFTGVVFQQGRFIETIIDPADGDCFIADNTGLSGGATSLLAIVECTASPAGAGNVVLRQSSGGSFVALGDLSHDDASETALLISGGILLLNVVNVVGRSLFSGATTVLGRRSSFEASGASVIDGGVAGVVVLLEGYTTLNGDTFPAISGLGGLLIRDLLAFTGSATAIVGLTLVFRRVDSADNVTYFPTAPAVNWAAPPPDLTSDALDRIATAVAGLLGFPIP